MNFHKLNPSIFIGLLFGAKEISPQIINFFQIFDQKVVKKMQLISKY